MAHGTLGVASAGMLSVDGRCKTLDVRANGYGRSEGIGALVLMSGLEADMLLGGSAVRQDGRSASLTAPNGSAQRTLLLAVLGRAALVPLQIGLIEAHGTGTALGDPTEAGSLAIVHSSADRDLSLALGAAKAATGHSEAPSGQVGLLAVRQELADANVGGNAQLRELNPLVSERLGVASACFALPTQVEPTDVQVPGVSSFGYSGTIAHAVVKRNVSYFHIPVDRVLLRSSRLDFQWCNVSNALSPLAPPCMSHAGLPVVTNSTQARSCCCSPHLLRQ
jgi:acyl transferase domain-containing protein